MIDLPELQTKFDLPSFKRFIFSGAGVVEMKFFTTVNVTDVRVRGTATRGEKIDIESYNFEGVFYDLWWIWFFIFYFAGEMVKLLQNRTFFPPGLSSLTNIQRQFFDSFVGQTFKVCDISWVATLSKLIIFVCCFNFLKARKGRFNPLVMTMNRDELQKVDKIK